MSASVWQAGLVLVAGCLFTVRLFIHVRRQPHVSPTGRTTGETIPGPNLPVVRPLVSAAVSESPDLARRRRADLGVTPSVAARNVSRVPGADDDLASPAPGALPHYPPEHKETGMGARLEDGRHE